nr:immunoglobulin light chain junction region [Macaca mulatta]
CQRHGNWPQLTV